MCYTEKEKNKLLGFKFFKNKYQRYTVLVDTKIPTLDSTVPTPCFSRTEIANETWISLIEKAYAKFNGGYAKINGLSLREAVNDLTGLELEVIVIDKPENLNLANFNEFLRLS
jgi:hypothetical protein